VVAATVWQVLHFSWAAVALPLAAARLRFDGFLVLLACSECISYFLYLGIAIATRKTPPTQPEQLEHLHHTCVE
jgi:hypothetical protein